MIRSTVTGVALAAALVLGSCSGASSGEGGDRPAIVVTTTPLGDIASAIIGDAGSVDVLMPIGADPHDFALSVRQVASLQEADLIITSGLDFEAGLGDALSAAEKADVTVLSLGEQLDPRPQSLGQTVADPHWFTDPARMADAADLITEAASDELGSAEGLRARGAQTRRDLLALDVEIRELLAAIPDARRVLVTNHEVLDYFAARYGFEVVGTVVPGVTGLAETSPRALADLVDTIIARDVPAVFADTSSSTDLARALAAEVGRPVDVVELFTESLGAPGSGGETYAEMMRTNAERIRDALA